MTSSKLNETAIESLIGRKIFSAGDNWIKLDNGCIIYLDDSEIDVLNS
jgi:hypothetical protein